MKKIMLFLFLSLFLAGCSQEPPLRVNEKNDEIQVSLEKQIPGLIDRDKITGVSVAVVRGGETAFFQSYGLADAGKAIKVSETTIFEAASLGKPVFGYLVLQLVKEGRLDLDKPVVQYAPDQLPAKTGGWEKITARMLLSHTAGIGSYSAENKAKLNTEPGKAFQYSGVGYDILQAVVEQVMGSSLKGLADQYVFTPLKMEASSFIWRDSYAPYFAKGYDRNSKELTQKRKPEKGAAAWSLYTSASDYAKFVSVMLQEIAKDDGPYSYMITPNLPFSKDVSWGVGWGLQNTKPNISFWHWGSNPGYRSFVVGYPKEGLGIVVLSNSENLFKAVDEIIQTAIGGALPGYHWF